MPKFRKKPVEVEAWQFWAGQSRKLAGVVAHQGAYYVTTIHGQKAWLADGDWVITEPDGKHYYPCKPDIFEATYEPVT